MADNQPIVNDKYAPLANLLADLIAKYAYVIDDEEQTNCVQDNEDNSLHHEKTAG